MSQVVTFERYRPPIRYDAIVWTQASLQESADGATGWSTIDTFTLSPVDTDAEHPAYRNFTTNNGTALDYWYRIFFSDGDGNQSQPTTAVKNATGLISGAVVSFVSVDELARILKIRNPDTNQEAALERVLLQAAQEIHDEIQLATATVLTNAQLATCEEVNLERAVEHWRSQESPFGLTGLGGELGAVFTAKDSWERYALKLAYLKEDWGMA
jgi:hypothetical protein